MLGGVMMDKKQKKIASEFKWIGFAFIFFSVLIWWDTGNNFTIIHLISIIFGSLLWLIGMFVDNLPDKKDETLKAGERNITEQLMNLKRLHDEEIISLEEFNQKKDELIKKL